MTDPVTPRRRIIILGINGHVGHHAAVAFHKAGWEVTGFGRTNRHPIPGVHFIAGDADDVKAMRAAIGDIDVVFNGLNLPYAAWDKGRMEAQNERVIAAMGRSGKTLLFPGNVYNYAASDRLMTPDLPQHPQTPRGEIRKRVEAMYAATAQRGDMQVLVLRAGDFFGPDSTGDWFDLIMLREANKRKLALLGAPGVSHQWAYLPDLARAFVSLTESRAELGRYETFHFGGHFVTPEVMGEAIVAASPVPLKTSFFPRVLITLMGLVDPTMREVAKMGYLWDHPMELRDPRLDALLGLDFATPLPEAVRATAMPFFAEQQLAA
ncbi:NAD-dependent epimerase/dehydratase family protein [Devosia sp.]|uniref:NAD-dependent epimerase/dehydratase family protein n=1 Tax=Devosia sp. TaxID=1871048 RepID=UPI003A92AE3B